MAVGGSSFNSANPSYSALYPKASAFCETCAARKYQDKSDDPGVSFQMGTHVSAAASVAMVSSHEQEHVSRENQDAKEKGQKAITNVRIHMDQCPECKKWYASGGVTEVTKISSGDNFGIGSLIDMEI